MGNFLIVQSRWIRNSDQNGEFVVTTSGRRKEAHGLLRHHFNSHMQMVIKHRYPAEDWHIDEENFSIALADENGIWYHSKFFIVEER